MPEDLLESTYQKLNIIKGIVLLARSSDSAGLGVVPIF